MTAKPNFVVAVEAALIEDIRKMRKAGCNMAIAGMHVVNEYDGVHRLSLAISEWQRVIGNEGGRKCETKTEELTDNELYARLFWLFFGMFLGFWLGAFIGFFLT